MFTGIIIDKGRIISVEAKDQDRVFRIQTSIDIERFAIGASVCCSGCCLTVVEKGPDWLQFYVSSETLAKTNLGEWKESTEVNLEPSLRLGDELGGHIVSGHVDGQAIIKSIVADGDSWRFKIEVPQEFKKFIATKGSIALDGISLTVNEVEDNIFGVNIIPHTMQVTTLGDRKAGDKLNFEIDTLARYMQRMLG